MSVGSAFKICAAIVILAVPGFAVATRHAALKPVPSLTHRSLGAALAYPAADTCFVSANQTIIYRIDGWVTGNEQYASLLDPATSCSNSYPFTVTAIRTGGKVILFDTGFGANGPATVAQGQTLTHRRLHRRRLPLAQEREEYARRLAAARAL